MGLVIIVLMSTMKENGTQTRDVDGVECITRMGLSTRVNGLKTREMVKGY